MEKNIKKILIPILLLILGSPLLHAQTDPFYLKLFQEGKEQYEMGKYREAAESFKIAEFGLIEDEDHLLEIYLYCALTQLNLNNLKEAVASLKKIETELHIKDLDKVSIPLTIYNPIKALRIIQAGSGAIEEGSNWRKNYRFELLAMEVMENLERAPLEELFEDIKKLEAINESAPRFYYIKGVFEFRRKSYKASIRALRKIDLTNVDELNRDKTHSYLALSYHYLNKRAKAIKHYDQIISLILKQPVYEIIKAKQ